MTSGIQRSFTNELRDADSQYTYLAMCKARLEAEPGYIPLAGYRQYEHPLVHARPGDVICEGGIENGESTLSFCQRCGSKGRIFAFEPLSENFESLKSLFDGNPSVKLERLALWDHPGRVAFMKRATNCATVLAGDADDYWKCTSIDAYFASGPTLDLIKLDVEGAEPEVLRGARVTIENACPRIMCCIYHGSRGLDWITVPRILLDFADRYTFFCGHHEPWYFETVVYALPSASV